MAPEAPRALPRGPHQLSREEVARSQRERLLEAATEAVAAQGYVKTTVADILARAGVSRATFYEQFTDREDCFHAAYRRAAELVARTMARELEGSGAADPGTPLARLDRVLGAYLRALHDEPALARVFLVEVYAAGPAAIEQRRASLEQFVDIVADAFRGEAGILGSRPEQRFAAQAFVGAVSSLVTNAVGVGDVAGLLDLRAPLIALAAQITKS